MKFRSIAKRLPKLTTILSKAPTGFEHMNTVFKPLKAFFILSHFRTMISTIKIFLKKISVMHCIVLCRITDNHTCYKI